MLLLDAEGESNMMELQKPVTERRRQTRNSIYKFIYDAPKPVSKQEISESLGYSLPTINQNITELLAAGLIRVGVIKESTGGRPPVGYEAVGSVRYAIGIAVSANYLRFLVCDVNQQQLNYKRIHIEANLADEFARQIQRELDLFMRENKLDSSQLLGVGLTIPGIIDHEKDEIILSPTMNIRKMSLGIIRKLIPYPLYFENDSHSAGYAEWICSEQKEKNRNMVYLQLENGIGGTAFIGGHQIMGNNNRCSEFGHMRVEPGGLSCSCGQKGCLEAYCSAFRFTRDLGIQIEEFFDGLSKGNIEYAKLWDDVLEHLSIGIYNLRMVYDSDIVLGGFVSEYLEPYLPRLGQMVAERSPFDDDGSFIYIGKHPRNAAMMGVAWHFTSEFIENV